MAEVGVRIFFKVIEIIYNLAAVIAQQRTHCRMAPFKDGLHLNVDFLKNYHPSLEIRWPFLWL